MTKDSPRLVAYGFVKEGIDKDKISVDYKGQKVIVTGKTPSEKLAFIRETFGEDANSLFEPLASHDLFEAAKDQLITSEFPQCINRYHISLESWQQNLENYYYWCLNFLNDIGFGTIHKITDIFSASENSSFYGASGQRLGLAQDKVGQYLATIGKMIKDLFQIVRELRWIDERLEIYNEAITQLSEDGSVKSEPKKGAENALKGMWIDLVDGVVGGQRTGSNLITMAQQLQYVALPDLFFAIHPQKQEDVDSEIEKHAGAFNEQVKNVLRRKLSQYIAWKRATYDEIKSRRIFTLDYLRQHYDVISLYMNWIKPYLKHIERLSNNQNLLDNPRLVSAFESNIVEIEILAARKNKDQKKQNICILLKFEYHSKPQMQFAGDGGYHRGPIHTGQTQIVWRGYAWDDDQIKNYIDMRTMKDLETLSSIDSSLKSAMDQLGQDVQKYLKEAREGKKSNKKEEKKPLKLDILEPFTAVGKGTVDFMKALVPSFSLGKSSGGGGKEEPEIGGARRMCFLHYNVFKKAHGLLSW